MEFERKDSEFMDKFFDVWAQAIADWIDSEIMKNIVEAGKRLDDASIPMDDRLYADENGIHNCSGEIVFPVDSEIFNQVKSEFPDSERNTKLINVKDVNGNWVILNADSFYTAFVENNLSLNGMNHSEIILLQQEYESRGGTYPITQESIKKAFQVHRHRLNPHGSGSDTF